MKNIPQERKEHIIDRIVQENHLFSDDEIEAFLNINIDHSIFKHPYWDYLAFQAFLEGSLNENQLSTLMIYKASEQEDLNQKPEMHELIDQEGRVNPFSLETVNGFHLTCSSF